MAKPSTYATAQKLFLATLVKMLFDYNEFVKASRNWNKYANAESVNWNESGGGTKSRRNGTRGAAARRNDVKRSYDVHEFKTDPTILHWVEEIVTNYAKRQSILEEHVEQVAEDIAMYALWRWAKSSSGIVIETTGDTKKGIDGTDACAVTPDEFFDAQTKMDEEKVPDDGTRVALVPAHMMGDLRKYKEFHSRDRYPGMVLATGAIGKIAGFNIMKRSKTILYDAAGEPIEFKANGSADEHTVVAGDSRTISLWHPKFVTRAVSKHSVVKIIDTHEGLELSTTTIASGDVLYQNGRGFATIREKKKVA